MKMAKGHRAGQVEGEKDHCAATHACTITEEQGLKVTQRTLISPGKKNDLAELGQEQSKLL